MSLIELRQKVNRLLDLSGHAPRDTHRESREDADAILAQLEAMQAEIERLRAEIARLRNIMNEDGLHDPELAKLAGKHRDVLEASTDKGGRKFRASLDKEGEK